jgi:hypothetical protein
VQPAGEHVRNGDIVSPPLAYFAMGFEILGRITAIEQIALSTSIRELERLRRAYGDGRWRKLKGIATIRLADGTVTMAEVHWYEAHGVGRKELKIKHFLDE